MHIFGAKYCFAPVFSLRVKPDVCCRGRNGQWDFANVSKLQLLERSVSESGTTFAFFRLTSKCWLVGETNRTSYLQDWEQ